jgi:hypothetical protein
MFDRPDELVQAMERVQNDAGYRQRLARSGSESFRKYWSEAAVMPRYLDVVRKTAVKKGRSDVVERLETGLLR